MAVAMNQDHTALYIGLSYLTVYCKASKVRSLSYRRSSPGKSKLNLPPDLFLTVTSNLQLFGSP